VRAYSFGASRHRNPLRKTTMRPLWISRSSTRATPEMAENTARSAASAPPTTITFTHGRTPVVRDYWQKRGQLTLASGGRRTSGGTSWKRLGLCGTLAAFPATNAGGPRLVTIPLMPKPARPALWDALAVCATARSRFDGILVRRRAILVFH
jgi:hypothetical protein